MKNLHSDVNFKPPYTKKRHTNSEFVSEQLTTKKMQYTDVKCLIRHFINIINSNLPHFLHS